MKFDIRTDHPIGVSHEPGKRRIVVHVILELGVILLSVVCFIVLDLYVAGCEKV